MVNAFDNTAYIDWFLFQPDQLKEVIDFGIPDDPLNLGNQSIPTTWLRVSHADFDIFFLFPSSIEFLYLA